MTAPAKTRANVLIAGVPWPVYKLVALAVGAVVLMVVGLVTLSAGPAVIAGAGATAIVWLALGLFHAADE
ncbi:hypothetical protein [Mycolicibacterium grossiae]|uniref:Uncharacterized protein n=1 Tax=Mycolicibacterium grossiae TaxID=1552759 RepID=A0A1E8Q0A5_9MYCO|nr:hypothetical protein [Mycolicibacterium grossiae]OFJ51480.1 hypothetical protein BEL07_22600 [Mycolicibacterium grossiae]QEM46533.1 hypothetical protein FZ046_18705 [Mycolicibacterium grossiae]